MKIGILTYHRAENYGAELQAIALRTTLESMGHSVFFIDYYPEYHQKGYAIPKIDKKLIYKHPHWYYRLQRDNFYKWLRKRHFKKFQNKYITPYCVSINTEFDVIVYGSDQIWRKQSSIQSYNPIYFGQNNIKTKRHISYAASAICPPKSETDKKELKRLLSYINKISVRETWLQELISSLGYTAELSIDPAFLLSSHEWDELIPTTPYNGKKYILCYDLFNVFTDTYIEQFAQKKELDVIKLTGSASYTKIPNIMMTAGPIEFLKLIKNAEYVITSSFHGLVFSLIYHKKFLSSSIPDYSQRIKSLNDYLGTSLWYIENENKFPDDIQELPYDTIDNKILEFKRNSINYLLKYLY